jgi:aryl-alcohol dehydrogenase-like predicted oxidoreductase
MADREMTRREFIECSAAAAAAGIVAGIGLPLAGAAETAATGTPAFDKAKVPSYNENMEYRPLGKTGLWVSAVCLGGHWKRIDKALGAKKEMNPYGGPSADMQSAFDQNRHDIVSRCIELGINFVDACTTAEVQAYSKALKGRRDKMYMGCSWYENEMRNDKFRTTKALLDTLDKGMKDAGLDHVDLWRIVMHERSSQHTEGEVHEMIRALEEARKQGKARLTGLSSHDRPHIKWMIETFPGTIQAVCTPYTADSKVLPDDSVFDAVKKHGVGVFGIKPFASNSLFKGDSSPNSPTADEDDRRARLAIRNILANPAITAPIPGLVTIHQVDNVAKAVAERRQLDRSEKAELRQAATEMWANLPPDYQWLKDWEYV